MARDRKPPRRRTHRGTRHRARLAAAVAALAAGGTVLVLAGIPAAARAPPRGTTSPRTRRTSTGRARRRRAPPSSTSRRPSRPTTSAPSFTQQYNGARAAGIIRGAYHFALPNKSSGTTQAAYFVAHGGGWKADGWTLPPALDIEYNPYDKKHGCYGLEQGEDDRLDQGLQRRGEAGDRPPPGDLHDRPLVEHLHGQQHRPGLDTRAVDRPPRVGGRGLALPAGWSYWTFWQYDNSGSLPGDQNLFNGTTKPTEEVRPGLLARTDTPETPSVHLPFIQVAYGQRANDLERLPG